MDGGHILVVGRADSLGTLVSNSLRARGWRLLLASDQVGDEAVALADAIVVDETNGMSAQSALQHLRGRTAAPAILVARGAGPGAAAASEAAGFVAHVVKPFSPSVFVALIELVARLERDGHPSSRCWVIDGGRLV